MKRFRGMIAPLILLMLISGCRVLESGQRAEVQQREIDIIVLSQKQEALVNTFLAYGSPHPVELAIAVSRLKRPRLAAAQAIVESGGDINRLGKLGEVGVWQVIEKYWGYVPDSIEEQAEKYEIIMDYLIDRSKGDIRKALNRYNGCKDGRYANRVYRIMAKINL